MCYEAIFWVFRMGRALVRVVLGLANILVFRVAGVTDDTCIIELLFFSRLMRLPKLGCLSSRKLQFMLDNALFAGRVNRFSTSVEPFASGKESRTCISLLSKTCLLI